MLDSLKFWFDLQFAGVWPLIGDWVLPLGIMAICIGLVLCMQLLPVWLQNILSPWEKDLLWVAVMIGLCLAWGAKMQRDDKARCDAKNGVVVTEVHRARTSAAAHHAPSSKWQTDQ